MKLKEEYGEYRGMLDEIADDLERGYTSGSGSNEEGDYTWYLTVNGEKLEDLLKTVEMRDWVCYEISYPVKDGHDYYNGLDTLFNNWSFNRHIDHTDEDVIQDLITLGFDEDNVRDMAKAGNAKSGNINDITEIETWIDYDIHYEVEEREEWYIVDRNGDRESDYYDDKEDADYECEQMNNDEDYEYGPYEVRSTLNESLNEYFDDELDDIVEYRVVFKDGTEDTSFNILNGRPFYDDYEIVCTEPDPENAMIWYAENKLGKEVDYIEINESLKPIHEKLRKEFISDKKTFVYDEMEDETGMNVIECTGMSSLGVAPTVGLKKKKKEKTINENMIDEVSPDDMLELIEDTFNPETGLSTTVTNNRETIKVIVSYSGDSVLTLDIKYQYLDEVGNVLDEISETDLSIKDALEELKNTFSNHTYLYDTVNLKESLNELKIMMNELSDELVDKVSKIRPKNFRRN